MQGGARPTLTSASRRGSGPSVYRRGFSGQPCAMQTIRRGYLDWRRADGSPGQLHYRRAGTGNRRPLLLLHQSPLSSNQFLPALPLLAEAGLDALALDMPGFGLSDPLSEPRSLEGYAAAAAAAMDHAGWASADVLGHHTGAVVAAVLATTAPARVRKLILNGMPLLSEPEKAFFRGFYFGPVEPKADGSHLIDAWQKRIKATPGWTDVAAMHRLLVDGLVSSATNWMAFPLIIETDFAALLARITQPTLLFTNTGEDLYAATQRCHELRPDFAFAALEGGTHDIVDEQPAAWARSVVEFLS